MELAGGSQLQRSLRLALQDKPFVLTYEFSGVCYQAVAIGQVAEDGEGFYPS